MQEVIYWNPISHHKLSISEAPETGYDALELASMSRQSGLQLVFEDNQYVYSVRYEQWIESKFVEIYAVVQTPEHMRNDLIGDAFLALEKQDAAIKYWPFFKMKNSALLNWCKEVMDNHLPEEGAVVHHVYFTVDDIIEVIADRDPEIEIQSK